MATGDLTNNIRKLQQNLKKIKYEEKLDLTSLSKGVPAEFLPIYHYTFTMFSAAVLEKITEMDVGLFGKSDLKFMEGVYRILRDMFNFKPPITKDQFFSSSFAERKIIMCTAVIELVYKKHRSLRPQRENTSSFKVHSTLNSSSRNQSKVGFQGPKSSGYVVERGDSKPPDVRKVAGQPNRRPQSAPAQSSRAKPPIDRPAVQRALLEPPQDTCPKTPGILKATSSAVQVVYVPRAIVNPDDDVRGITPGPIDVVASSPVKSGAVGEPDLIYNTDQLSQLHLASSPQIPINSLHRSVETVMKRLEKVEDDIKSCVTRAESTDNPKITNLLVDVQNKMETAVARLLLLENRMTMVETKIQSRLNTEEVCGVGNQVTGVSVPEPGEVLIGGVCPSPIKHTPTVNGVLLITCNEPDTPEVEVRASTPTEKLSSSLILNCVDQTTKEKAERLNAMLKSTAEVLQSVTQS